MTLKFDPSIWKVTLPIYEPAEVIDNSVVSEYSRCPTRGFYKYGLRRGFQGVSYPIQFGLAYHKYRETVENIMFERGETMNEAIHTLGINAALDGWQEPPIGHRKDFLNMVRLAKTISLARSRIESEQHTGNIIITRPEESFDLPLPFIICMDCGYAHINDPLVKDECDNCCSSKIYQPRHGGRVDQFIKLGSEKNAIRDFKTTGTKGDYYEEKFDPNGQVQGYTWAGGELSGRSFDGALIETVYNTKTRGPEITQHYVNYSKGQQIRWMGSMMMEHSMIRAMYARVPELGFLAFPQRTSACSDFGGCHYRGACRTGSGWELEEWLKSETIESVWDFTNPDGEESTV